MKGASLVICTKATLEEIPFFFRPDKELSCVLIPVQPLTKETQFYQEEIIKKKKKQACVYEV